MCPLKREQARREMQQWVMDVYPLQTLLWRSGEKVGHEINTLLTHLTFTLRFALCVPQQQQQQQEHHSCYSSASAVASVRAAGDYNDDDDDSRSNTTDTASEGGGTSPSHDWSDESTTREQPHHRRYSASSPRFRGGGRRREQPPAVFSSLAEKRAWERERLKKDNHNTGTLTLDCMSVPSTPRVYATTNPRERRYFIHDLLILPISNYCLQWVNVS